MSKWYRVFGVIKTSGGDLLVLRFNNDSAGNYVNSGKSPYDTEIYLGDGTDGQGNQFMNRCNITCRQYKWFMENCQYT